MTIPSEVPAECRFSLRRSRAGGPQSDSDWAVFGATREEALERYQQAEAKHEELRQRDATSPTAPKQPSERSQTAAQD